MKNNTIVSTGLICLDIIQQKQGYWLMAGGSAINPLIILHTWGWNTYPIGRIGNDPAAQSIQQDLNFLGINHPFIFTDHNIPTPMYLMTMQDGGHIFHKQCPNCQTPFPKFSPLTDDMINGGMTQLPQHIDVCLIERLSAQALRLVKECKKRGAAVMFEPNRIEDEDLLDPMLAMTDIVKYSNERIPLLAGIEHRIPNHNVLLEMQTLGSDGIRFRCVQTDQNKWINMNALTSENFTDAAGAGDWTTARFLHELAKNDDLNSTLSHAETMKHIIHQAQQEAAKNCAHPAPRGQMYETRSQVTDRLPCPYCNK